VRLGSTVDRGEVEVFGWVEALALEDRATRILAAGMGKHSR
jgi:hypothetical protein